MQEPEYESVARPGHAGTIDLEAVERHLQLADETIAEAIKQLERVEAEPIQELTSALNEDAAHRLTLVNTRAKLLAPPADPAL
jgi:hypothetical protein